MCARMGLHRVGFGCIDLQGVPNGAHFAYFGRIAKRQENNCFRRKAAYVRKLEKITTFVVGCGQESTAANNTNLKTINYVFDLSMPGRGSA